MDKSTTNNKQGKEKVLKLVCNIFDYVSPRTSMIQWVDHLMQLYSYKDIYAYIHQNEEYLTRKLKETKFSTADGKVKYFFTIIKNNMDKFIDNQRTEIERESKEIIYPHKYKETKKRRALHDIEMELIAEDE